MIGVCEIKWVRSGYVRDKVGQIGGIWEIDG